MHMMFVDESGDPGYPQSRNWRTWRGSRLFVRVGVIIHGWKWKVWDNRLVSFKKDRGLTWDAEIKASYIRRGKKGFSGWDSVRRNQFLNDLLTIIGGNVDITLIGVSIDKTLVDTSQRSRITKPDVRSMELLLERYNGFLDSQKDKSGIVVLDSTQEANDENIRYFQSYLQAHSEHLKPQRIVEGTFFATSHTSNMIQVADICSNVFYRKETSVSGSNREFSLIYPRFWRRNSRVVGHGIKRWPARRTRQP